MTYPQIDPVIVTLGPLQLRWYSMMYVIGLSVVFLFFRYSVKRGTLKVTEEQAETLVAWGLVGMILGARIIYVLVYNLDHYIHHPSEIIAVWKGGLAFHGGFVGLALGAYFVARRQGLRYFNITDHVALAVPIGLGFGRIGNFINGELWGRVTDTSVPWAMVFPGAGPLPRHPSQLYESFFEGFVLLAFLWLVRLRRPKDGVISGCFILGYGVLRFFVEFFREPDAQLGPVLGPFSMGQVLCTLMWIFGGFLIVYNMHRQEESAFTPAKA